MKANDHRTRTSRVHHFDGRLPGLFDEPEVEGQQSLASCGGAEMQCIGKIHTPIRVFESFGEHDRALHREARQSRERAQGGRDLRSGKAVYAAQHPFAFEQNRRADEDITRIDRGPRPGSISSGGKQRHAPQAGTPGRFRAGALRSVQSSSHGPVRQISAHLRSHQHPTPTARSGGARRSPPPQVHPFAIRTRRSARPGSRELPLRLPQADRRAHASRIAWSPDALHAEGDRTGVGAHSPGRGTFVAET